MDVLGDVLETLELNLPPSNQNIYSIPLLVPQYPRNPRTTRPRCWPKAGQRRNDDQGQQHQQQ